MLPSSRQLVLFSLHSMQGARPKLLKSLMNDLANDRYENIRQLFSTAESTMSGSGLDLPFLIFRDFLENAQKHKSQLWKALDALDKLDEDYFQVFFNRQTGQLEHEIFTRYNTISSQIDFKNLNQTLLLGFISYLEDRLARGFNIKPDSLDQYPKYRDFLKFVAKLPKTTSK
ncbi:MAG: hypothetical protein LW817_03580 [Candidatus Caenarcaniphilales bacterium]|nr:hypothetical protein [Candidatus Caenarcaniphilales bacterium]